MNGLPLDIVKIIAGHLSVLDLHSLSKTSKKFSILWKPWNDSFSAHIDGWGLDVVEQGGDEVEEFYEVKVCLIGPAKCGKTTTCIVYTTNAVPGEYCPEVMEPYYARIMVDGNKCKVLLLDSCSNIEPAMVRHWKWVDIFMCCYDRSNPQQSLKDLERYVEIATVLNPKALLLYCGIKDPNFDQQSKKKEPKEVMPKVQNAVLIGTWQTGLRSAFDTAIFMVLQERWSQQNKQKKKGCFTCIS